MIDELFEWFDDGEDDFLWKVFFEFVFFFFGGWFFYEEDEYCG